MSGELFPTFILGPASGIGFGLWIFWMIATGKLITRREADAMVATIESQRKIIHSQNDQLHMVMAETAPTLTEFLSDLRVAVESAKKVEDMKQENNGTNT